MAIARSVNLQPYNSFGVPATAACFTTVRRKAELEQALAYAESEKLPVYVLGAGSNVLFTRDYHGLVVQIGNRGIAWPADSDEPARVRIAAGENWHGLVKACLDKKLHGLENLALIPGTAGAAPMQNIGAYGAELADVFVELTAYDRQARRWLNLDRTACEFAYRDSLFKQAGAGRYIIFELTLELSRQWRPNLDYQVLAEAFGDTRPEAEQVFEAVCRIRRARLPDPARLGNAGSFFRNPVVSSEQYAALVEQLPDLPGFPQKTHKKEGGGKEGGEENREQDSIRIPAAWLLDRLGWKGRRWGAAAVHADHALVLVNPGEASGQDILALAREMSDSVLENFGIALQPEVQIL